jgi:hypothetical protein
MTIETYVGAFPLPLVVKTLREFAVDYGRGGSRCVYVVYGNILTREDRVLNNPQLVMKVMSHHGRMIKVDLPFTANGVMAGTNLRIFGLGGDPRLTAKIRMHGGLLYREVTARQAFARALSGRVPLLGMPAVLEHDSRKGLWLVEQFVEAGHLNSSDMAAFLATCASDFYRATARLRPVLRWRRHEEAIADLVRAAPSFGTVPERGIWPVALCHGDLLKHNVLRAADGRFWLIDLELSDVQPVAMDLAHALVEEPRLKAYVLEVLRRLGPSGKVLRPELQLALGLAAELRKRQKRRPGLIQDQMKMFGKSRAEAEEIADAQLVRIAELIRMLASPP